ncbi:beta subunit of citrate lyase [Fragilariopsis cylindrus CCMP1102]|uniref:Beta subunit of citrate lyase n=1 Tax=Fragilariopsis cylindrus CCMP1102 TaxID=635003 RepID=A0A1E7FY84_9STRA|nr:beta subunit of citrate lyase [Fragilariopsis cylindrus CCMP1102]|eukprot:OEU23108.1 beta subunit of citrate lyase [Fragilariopsis cylindrus CCMP1102]
MIRRQTLLLRTIKATSRPRYTVISHGESLQYCCRRRGISSNSTSELIAQGQQQQRKRPERPRRSLFSVPGSDERKILKAQTLLADSIVLDLEDGVAYDRKDEAREIVRNTLLDTSKTFVGGNSTELCVRINGLDTNEIALNDLNAILLCDRLQAIVIPKVESASDIHFVSRMIDTHCNNNKDIRIIAAIESAMGFLNLREIANTSTICGNRLDALVFASEDFCADIEAIPKAYSLQAIDMVHINFRDQNELKNECITGRQLGFTGKQAIHPNQIDIIHDQFSPSLKDILFATKAVKEFQHTTTIDGKGSCVVDGIVVDLPVYKWAVKMCKRAEKMK